MAEEKTEKPQKAVKVVVLGDIGRSPRMQYHSLSLASNGFKVDLIGYVESAPLTEILENRDITITKLQPLLFNAGPRILQYLIKAFWQSVSLFLTLCVTGKCDYLLCQNPPAIPTLPVCRFYCLITKTKFVIDWHNYAYSIMALSFSPNHPMLRISRRIEEYFGQSSNSNLCVTYAMKNDLMENWNVVASVLYDRPPKIFHPLTLEEKHNWFLKISQQYPEFACPGRDLLNLPSPGVAEKTAFTQVVGNKVEWRKERPGLLFSSTSWTQDEDFSVLMEALQEYETTVACTELFSGAAAIGKNIYNQSKKLPNLICVITGKGPMKEHYIKKVASSKWKHVKVVTPWLEASDYPKMVGCGDLGVCLHTSSSGLDLPMKVVDMFGAGLPVCAFDFTCLHELVENGVNGYTFKTSAELSSLIIQWFKHFPHSEQQNVIANKMRESLSKFQESRWEDNWNLRVKKIFDL